VNFKDAYAFAAVPSRYLLEQKMWKDAARIEIEPSSFPWQKFTWEKAIFHFARAMGSIHTGDLNGARNEVSKLKVIYDTLQHQMEDSKANSVDIQIRASEAWILFKEGKTHLALRQMDSAADLEDATRIGAVSPGDILPARELLGDMYLQMGNPALALQAYQEDLRIHPNRFNGLYGAGKAAEKSGDRLQAVRYYQKLLDQSATHSRRPEIADAKQFLKTGN
jgi:tetratricopeptide (TPR) repeat protein